MNITENEIVCVEEFVRNELEQRMLDRCTRLETEFNANEMECFFGMYAGSIKEFKLLRGERIQILGLAENLRTMFTEKGKEEFVKHFDVPDNFIIDKSGTYHFSFGWFYGQKPRKRVNKLVTLVESPQQLKDKLFTKVKKMFTSFDLEKMQDIIEDIVQVVDLGSSIRGDIICVFCPKSEQNHAIQYDKAGKWNLSNIRKHIKIHVKKAKDEKEARNLFGDSFTESQSKTSSIHTSETNSNGSVDKSESSEPAKINDSPTSFNASEIMTMPILLEDFGIHFEENTEISSALYALFSKQNLRLVEATMEYNESIKTMVSKNNNQCVNVNIVRIDRDGNCLFGAIVHQLEYVQNKSAGHIAQTAVLCKQVVDHITDNFESYKHVLQLKLACADKEIDKMGKQFLTDDLSKSGYLGGSESLMAVADIFKVNILVFNENGPFYFATGFQPEYDRCIFLAYRKRENLNGEIEYYHYDSVCGIEADVLFNCAFDLG